MKGGKQDIVIASPTPDAEVRVKSFRGPEVYQGPPGKVTLAREDQYTVSVTAPGYRERKVVITKSVSGWMFANVVWVIPIFWGVGIAVDAMSGGLWTLGDSHINVPLVREASTPPAPPPAPAPSLPVPPPDGASEPAASAGY